MSDRPLYGVTIEGFLRWAYGPQQLGAEAAMPADYRTGFGASSRDGVATAIERGRTGIGGDGCARSAAIGRGAHPDAFTVARVVQEVCARPTLVAEHAKLGTRPEWRNNNPFRARPVVHLRGGAHAIVKEYDRNRNWIFSPIEYVGLTAEEVRRLRMVYSEWRAELEALRNWFTKNKRTLLNHVIQPPLPPATPWKSRVLCAA
ncbi:MAG: hypothetical protein Tsb0010_09740 [Parvularculaceae bacterium]